MNISLKRIGLLLILITYTVEVKLFSQKTKNTLDVSITSTSNSFTKKGTVEFKISNGTPPYYIVIANKNNQYTYDVESNNFTAKEISFDTYTVAVSDKNSKFHIGSIEIK